MYDLKIRNANEAQFSIVASAAAYNVGRIQEPGRHNGVYLSRNGLNFYLYFTESGSTLVAVVEQDQRKG